MRYFIIILLAFMSANVIGGEISMSDKDNSEITIDTEVSEQTTP